MKKRLRFLLIILLCALVLSTVNIGGYFIYDHYRQVESVVPIEPETPDEPDNPITPGTDEGDEIFWSRTFNENSWPTISKVSTIISEKNMTNEEVTEAFGWHVGDKKSVHISILDNLYEEDIFIRILDFNKDTRSSDHKSKAGITLEMEGCLPSVYDFSAEPPQFLTEGQIHSSNNGYWDTCDLRTKYLPKYKNYLPEELRNIILPVDKTVCGGYDFTTMVSDELFVLSMGDVFSQTAIKNSKNLMLSDAAQYFIQEGSQYEFYKNLIGDADPSVNNEKLIKTQTHIDIQKYSLSMNMAKNTKCSWFLRSKILDKGTYIRCTSDGSQVNTYAMMSDYWGDEISRAETSFAFCV